MTQTLLQNGPVPLFDPQGMFAAHSASAQTVQLSASGRYFAFLFAAFDAYAIDTIEFVITTITSGPAEGEVRIVDISSNAPGTTFNGGTLKSQTFSTSSANSKVTVTGLDATLARGDLYAIQILWTSGDFLVLAGYGSTASAYGWPYCIRNEASVTRLDLAPVSLGAKTSGGVILPIHRAMVGPLAAQTAATVSTSGNPDEFGVAFQVSAPCRCRGLSIRTAGNSASATLRARLYSDPLGTPSTLATKTHAMANYLDQASGVRVLDLPFDSDIDLSTGTVYAAAIRAADTTSISIPYAEYHADADTAYFRRHANVRGISREGDSGAFATNDATWGKRITLINPLISHIDDATGGGGETFTGTLINRGIN
ncbi:MAG: hypothetical protein KIT81_06970 [Alphaproteobacteria bacterium]|nr:hypothetical protein [Alphaproteobacteria bacterium]